MNKINLVGKKFGRFLVIQKEKDYISPKGQHSTQYMCRCDCGINKIVRYTNLLSENSLSCGCLRTENNINDLTGKLFGNLRVIKLDYVRKGRKRDAHWVCQCKCGSRITVRSSSLINGNTRSCGCLLISSTANEIKNYLVSNYNAVSEYKVLRNPKTNRWLPFDVYLPNQNIFIEINGLQHYVYTVYFHKTKERFENYKNNDKIKKKFAKKNGTYMEIDLRKYKRAEEAIKYICQRLTD